MMRITTKIGPFELIMLIDSGSTHNFISSRMADMLQLLVIPTESFMVKVANGERLKCDRRFDQVPVNLQGIPFSLTLYFLPLVGFDILLGI